MADPSDLGHGKKRPYSCKISFPHITPPVFLCHFLWAGHHCEEPLACEATIHYNTNFIVLICSFLIVTYGETIVCCHLKQYISSLPAHRLDAAVSRAASDASAGPQEMGKVDSTRTRTTVLLQRRSSSLQH